MEGIFIHIIVINFIILSTCSNLTDTSIYDISYKNDEIWTNRKIDKLIKSVHSIYKSNFSEC